MREAHRLMLSSSVGKVNTLLVCSVMSYEIRFCEGKGGCDKLFMEALSIHTRE